MGFSFGEKGVTPFTGCPRRRSETTQEVIQAQPPTLRAGAIGKDTGCLRVHITFLQNAPTSKPGPASEICAASKPGGCLGLVSEP